MQGRVATRPLKSSPLPTSSPPHPKPHSAPPTHHAPPPTFSPLHFSHFRAIFLPSMLYLPARLLTQVDFLLADEYLPNQGTYTGCLDRTLFGAVPSHDFKARTYRDDAFSSASFLCSEILNIPIWFGKCDYYRKRPFLQSGECESHPDTVNRGTLNTSSRTRHPPSSSSTHQPQSHVFYSGILCQSQSF